MIYVKVDLNVGATYSIPLNHLKILTDEIETAAGEGAMGEIWTISLVEMTEQEYAELPDFRGH